MKKISQNMEKPKKPIEPKWEKYDTPVEPTGKNHLGNNVFEKLDFINDYKKYQKSLEKYEKDLEMWNQLKMIKLIRNAKDEYILRKFKIIELK